VISLQYCSAMLLGLHLTYFLNYPVIKYSLKSGILKRHWRVEFLSEGDKVHVAGIADVAQTDEAGGIGSFWLFRWFWLR
jgi:hypothetical protein